MIEPKTLPADKTDGPVHIIRYPNRKMYIAGQGYVSLAQVDAFVQRGQAFRVVAAGVGEDLTAEILARVALHRARFGRVSQQALERALASDGAG